MWHRMTCYLHIPTSCHPFISDPLALKRSVAAHRFLNKICFNKGYLSGPKVCRSNLETPYIYTVYILPWKLCISGHKMIWTFMLHFQSRITPWSLSVHIKLICIVSMVDGTAEHHQTESPGTQYMAWIPSMSEQMFEMASMGCSAHDSWWIASLVWMFWALSE